MHLGLSHNGIAQLPHTLVGVLPPSLQSLDLSHNALADGAPAVRALSTLSNLKLLWLMVRRYITCIHV